MATDPAPLSSFPSTTATRARPRKNQGNASRKPAVSADPATSPPPGIRELAARLGLGISTVSRAMNNRDRVDAKTRQRVMEMARKIGYVPDATARRLKSHPRLRVEVCFSPYRDSHQAINPAALATIDALQRRAADRGILLTVREFPQPGTRAESEVAASLREHVKERTSDVLITYGHFQESTLAVFKDSGLPVVRLQARPLAARQIGVVVDTRTAAYQAVEYMAALGHSRIALIAGGRESLHHRGYIEGFDDAVAEYRLRAPDAWRTPLTAAELNEESTQRLLAPLLRLPAAERPTALVFASDWLALGGLGAARSADLRVPQDVSVIGFDNVEKAAKATPPLTTFDVHHDTMADAVLDAATELMENPQAPETDERSIRMVRADLVKRASCAVWGR